MPLHNENKEFVPGFSSGEVGERARGAGRKGVMFMGQDAHGRRFFLEMGPLFIQSVILVFNILFL